MTNGSQSTETTEEPDMDQCYDLYDELMGQAENSMSENKKSGYSPRRLTYSPEDTAKTTGPQPTLTINPRTDQLEDSGGMEWSETGTAMENPAPTTYAVESLT